MPARALMCLVALGAFALAQEPVPKFGTTVVIPGGLRALIYHIPHNTRRLPDFYRLKPVGWIYTSSLNVPPPNFKEGFRGVTDRFEWFALDYSGRFWIDKPGLYTWDMISDDGARLYLDDQLIIDNDGVHEPEERMGSLRLAAGVHRIRVSYFQGPRFQVALVLKVAPPGEPLRIFSTDEFKPPPHPDNWPPEAETPAP